MDAVIDNREKPLDKGSKDYQLAEKIAEQLKDTSKGGKMTKDKEKELEWEVLSGLKDQKL